MDNAKEKLSDAQINQINLTMRGKPWYQEWFRQRGLDQNKVHLSDHEQAELANLAARNGMPIPDDMHIDPAGNVNSKHGFAGLPTWAKIAIAAAPVAATAGFGAAGLGPLAGMLGGSSPVVAGTVGPTSILSATGGGAVAAPSLMSTIAGMTSKPLVSAAGRMISAAGNASAANRGSTIDAMLAHDQLGLQAEREHRDAEGDAFRKSLYGQIAAGYQPSARPAGVPSRNPTEGFITPQAREAGQMMTDTAMQRMRSGDYGTNITPFSQLPTKPGLFERIANYAGPGLSLFDPRLYDAKGNPISHA